VTDGTLLPLVIAHRGASRDAPGNTPAAFELAIAQGADAVELDVRRTLDGVLVVHHNASRRGVLVAMQTHATLLRRSRNEVPRLETILDLCRGRVGLDVEIKEPGYEAEVIEAASSRFSRDQLLYTSFEETVIATVKRLDPNARCGLILGPGRLRSRAQRYEAPGGPPVARAASNTEQGTEVRRHGTGRGGAAPQVPADGLDGGWTPAFARISVRRSRGGDNHRPTGARGRDQAGHRHLRRTGRFHASPRNRTLAPGVD
jgi:glycerophosphoryl diester phosphodiesterase